MVRLVLYFDELPVDDIYVNSVEEALEVFENHSLRFEDQNEELQRWWSRANNRGITPLVELRYADPVKGKYCPHCGKPLYPTDVRGYDYTCYECDENFYECETCGG